ncbi:unnamed protein product [Phytomonas sp. EM1]|nr:unnamed protein product [Phytomonas sp. EM1]|eukprot:CCW62543.1 unnamed protein product [Phytomonas sp. isolate EM1]
MQPLSLHCLAAHSSRSSAQTTGLDSSQFQASREFSSPHRPFRHSEAGSHAERDHCPPPEMTFQSIFHLNPLLVVCFVRHLDQEGRQVATPHCVEETIRELQACFSKPIPTSSIHPQQLKPNGGSNATQRVGSSATIQFGKALEVFSGSGVAALNIFVYSTNEPYSRPKSCASIAKEWREQLTKDGNESSLVLLHHKDFASPESLTLKDQNPAEDGNSKGKSASTIQAKRDAAAAALKPYYAELRACRFAPQQVCIYIPHEAPQKLLECLRVASIRRMRSLEDAFRRYLEKKQSLPREPALGNPNYTRHVGTNSNESLLLVLPAARTGSAAAQDSDPNHDRLPSISSPCPSPPLSGPHSRSNSSTTNGNLHNAKVENSAASLPQTPLNKYQIPARPSVLNATTPLMTAVPTTWSIQRFWQYGLDLARQYLIFGFLREASGVYGRLYMEYYNNSDDYSFVGKTETLERLARMPNLFDVRHIGGESGLMGYPKAVEQGAELIDGFLLITAHAMTCVTLLDDQATTAKKRFFDTFIDVVHEKFTEPPAAMLPQVHRDHFLLKCFLSGLSSLWLTYGLISSPLPASPASSLDAFGGVDGDARGGSSPNAPVHRKGNGAAILATVSDDFPQLESSFLRLLCGDVMDSDLVRGVGDDGEDPSTLNLFPDGQALPQKLMGMFFLEGKNTLNDSVARLVELAKLLALVPNDATPAIIADDVDSAALLRRSCAEIAALVASAKKVHLQLCEGLGYGNVATNWEGLNTHSKSNSCDSLPSDVRQATQRSLFEVEKFSTPGSARRFWRLLTALSAAASGISGQHRREYADYGALALSLLHENPKLTATIAATRLIPFIEKHSWRCLEYASRWLYVESLHKLFSLVQAREHGWDATTRERVWLLLFNTKTPYALFKECLLFLIGFTSEHRGGGAYSQPISYSLPGSPGIDMSHTTIPSYAFPSRKKSDFWEMMLRVDALVELPLLKGRAPEFSLDVVLWNPCVWAVPSGKVEGPTTPTTKTINVALLEPVSIFFNAECPVDILRTVLSSRCQTTTVSALLESRKEWSNSEEPIHLLKLTNPSTACYNPQTHRLELCFKTHPCHAGHYRLRCVQLVNGATRLGYYPPHVDLASTSTAQGNPNLSLSQPIHPRAMDDETGVCNPIPHSQGSTAPSFACSQVLFHVLERAGKVRLSISRPPGDEHCFADALSYFTVGIEMEEPLEVPSRQPGAPTDSDHARVSNTIPPLPPKTNPHEFKAGKDEEFESGCSFEEGPVSSPARGRYGGGVPSPSEAAFPLPPMRRPSRWGSTDTTGGGGGVISSTDPSVIAFLSIAPHSSPPLRLRPPGITGGRGVQTYTDPFLTPPPCVFYAPGVGIECAPGVFAEPPSPSPSLGREEGGKGASVVRPFTPLKLNFPQRSGVDIERGMGSLEGCSGRARGVDGEGDEKDLLAGGPRLALRNRVRVVLTSTSAFLFPSSTCKDTSGNTLSFEVPQSYAQHLATVRPSRIVLPLDLDATFSQLPKLHSISSHHQDEKDGASEVPLPFGVLGSVLLYPRRESRFCLLLPNDADRQGIEKKGEKDGNDADDKTKTPRTLSRADAGNLRALLEITHKMELRIPLLPLFMTHCQGQEINNDIYFCCLRQGDLSTTSCSVSFPFQEAIAAEYVFRHFESRVYCLVKLRNLLKQTSLWMRGVVLHVLDPKPIYHVAHVSEIYNDLITREWRPQEVRQILFELALRRDSSTVEAALHHSVQVEVFYSNWQKTYLTTSEEDRIVLHVTHLHGNRSTQGEGAETNITWVRDLQRETTDVNRNSDNSAAAAKLTEITFVEASPESASSRPHPNVLPRILSTASSPNRKSDAIPEGGLTTDRSVDYNPDELVFLSSSCNAYYGPPASFRSTHLCLFSAVIEAESTWTTQNGMTSDCIHPTAGMSSMSSGGLGTAVAALTEMTYDAIVGRSSEFVFVAGEPVRFCVRLHPLTHNWSEDAGVVDDFFIELQCDPTQWMVIGKKRKRQTLSATEDLTMYFTALPLLPEDPSVGPSHRPNSRSPEITRRFYSPSPDAVRVAADRQQRTCPRSLSGQRPSTEVMVHATMDESILMIPTIRVFRVPPHEGKDSGIFRRDAAADGKEEVLVDVVRFRHWARVTKKVR